MKRKSKLIPMKILLATSTLFVSTFSPVLAAEAVIIDTVESEEMKPTEEPIQEELLSEESEMEVEVVPEETIESVMEEPDLEEESVQEVPELEEVPVQEEPEIEEETVQEELPDLPEHNQVDTYELAMQIMERDLQAKKNPPRMRTFSTFSVASSSTNYVDRFFETIIPYAIEDSVTSGILPSITIAQGALESAWGLSGLAVNANNLFGIKASADWKGPVYNVITSEYAKPQLDSKGKVIKEGYWYQVVAPFRKYDSWLGSIRDHGVFFTGTEWRRNNYRFVVGEKDYRKAANALSAAGYATDPGYANKLISIIENYDLAKYDHVPVLKVDYHMQKHGWLSKTGTNLTLGNANEKLRLEDMRFLLPNNDKVSINYSANIQGRGWVNDVPEGYSTANEGQGLRMEAVKMNLTGEAAKSYDIYYRTYTDKLGWTGWAKNGEPAGTEGYYSAINSLEIIISWKGEVPVNLSSNAFRSYVQPQVNYLSHVQQKGWISWVKNGQTSGTVGQKLRMEAVQINLSSLPYAGGLEYQTHVQTHGWLRTVPTDSVSGTVGQGKRLEAIKIGLTGEMKRYFDVYYRTHVESYGWTGWAKNGSPSGSEGKGKRLEAIEIILVEKGGSAPGSTSNTFYR